MNLVDIKIEQPDDVSTQANATLANAQSFTVANAEDYQAAAEELSAIKGKWNEIEKSRKALKKPIDDAARAVQSFFKPPLDYLTRAESVLKRAMIAWKNEQDRIAREEKQKAEAKARKERDRLEKQAREAEEKGRAERAEVLRDRAVSTVAAAPVTEAPKVSGISTRTVWKFRVVDAAKVPDKYKLVDEKKIGGVVRALKGDTDIEGIEVWEESSMAARSA